MKISHDGALPQLELGPAIGGAKSLFQRSGIVMRPITMLSAMSAWWATSQGLRSVFGGSYALFLATAAGLILGWMLVDYILIYPSEQTFRQNQAHTEERSPLKRDHEELKTMLEGDD